MSSKTLTPEKQLSAMLRSIAKKNKAKSYAAWLNENTLDTRIGASDALVSASTSHAMSKREIAKDPTLAASGYGRYLLDREKSSYLGETTKIKDGLAQQAQKSISGYRGYVEGLENDRRDLVNSTFKSILTLGITDLNEAYKRAKSAGLSESDARAVAKDTTSAAINDLYQKAVSTIISRYYTSHQAKEYALALGLPTKDAEELARVADVLNQLTSNPNYYYSSDYVKYIDELKNTTK